jgi:hypothetical protein
MAYLPLFTSIISLIFAVTVLDQYFARRKSFQLLWAIGLFIYSAAAFTEFYSNVFGIVGIVYRLWYLMGGIYVAAYMGMGTLYLLMKRKTANRIMLVLGVFSVYALVRCLTAPIDLSGVTQLGVKGIMPVDARILAALFGTFGTVALVGGAAYSAWVFWRKRILPYRVVSNVLIAVGAFFPAFGGSAVTFFNNVQVLFIFELIGVIIMFAGFLRTKEVFGFFRFPLIHGFKKIEEKPAGQ